MIFDFSELFYLYLSERFAIRVRSPLNEFIPGVPIWICHSGLIKMYQAFEFSESRDFKRRKVFVYALLTDDRVR